MMSGLNGATRIVNQPRAYKAAFSPVKVKAGTKLWKILSDINAVLGFESGRYNFVYNDKESNAIVKVATIQRILISLSNLEREIKNHPDISRTQKIWVFLSIKQLRHYINKEIMPIQKRVNFLAAEKMKDICRNWLSRDKYSELLEKKSMIDGAVREVFGEKAFESFKAKTCLKLREDNRFMAEQDLLALPIRHLKVRLADLCDKFYFQIDCKKSGENHRLNLPPDNWHNWSQIPTQ